MKGDFCAFSGEARRLMVPGVTLQAPPAKKANKQDTNRSAQRQNRILKRTPTQDLNDYKSTQDRSQSFKCLIKERQNRNSIGH